MSSLERKARIFNVQKYNTADGPGVRTLVFFQGCPLRCRWCANPEGLERKNRVMMKYQLCISCGKCVHACPQGIHQIDPETGKHVVDRTKTCIACHNCEEACIQKAISIVGEDKPISEIIDLVKEDEMFYMASGGGGVTLGGGECTSQPEACLNVLQGCKQQGINTAIETCGYTSKENILKIAPYVDLFLFDIKQMDSDRHFELTGVHNERILENLSELLHRRYNVKVRMPVLHGYNDSDEEFDALVKFLTPFKDLKNFKGVDILPYHKLGVGKYTQLDMEYPITDDPSMPEERLSEIEAIIKNAGIEVNIIRH
ncbi:MAG: choline TMA-lyase-activating enzyme [Anaerovoracaceae bacterium]|jgi:choline TMA-lyase-activating enzyme